MLNKMMNAWPPLIAIALGLGSAHAQNFKATPTPPEYEAIARNTVQHWLIPRYQKVADDAEGLEAAATALCAKPNGTTLATAKQSLKKVQLSWAGVSLIKFGPINQQMRQYRMYFWPDKHGTGSRQFRRLMAAKPYDKLKPKVFREQSAALQGLGPAEKILADDEIWLKAASGEQRKFSCAMLHAITRSVQAISGEVISEWQQRLASAPKPAQVVSKPVAKTSPELKHQPKSSAEKYDNRDELYYKFIKATLDEAELTSFIRLGKVLGAKPAKAKPRLAEAYRQGLSIPIIKASLASTQVLLLGDGKALKGLVNPFSTTNLKANINQRFKRAYEALDAIDGPLDVAVKKDWQNVRKARFVINDLVTFLTETIALKAGIVFTFNSLDGD